MPDQVQRPLRVQRLDRQHMAIGSGFHRAVRHRAAIQPAGLQAIQRPVRPQRFGQANEAGDAVAGPRHAEHRRVPSLTGLDRYQRLISRHLGVRHHAQRLPEHLPQRGHMGRLHHAAVVARHAQGDQRLSRQRLAPAQGRQAVAALLGAQQVHRYTQRRRAVMRQCSAVRQFAGEVVLQLRIRHARPQPIQQLMFAATGHQGGKIRLPGFQVLQPRQLVGACRALRAPEQAAVGQQLPLQCTRPLPARLALVGQARHISVDQAQELDRLVRTQQLVGDLEGQYPTERPAGQAVRPLRLYAAHLLDVVAGQALQGARLWAVTRYAGQSVDSEVTGQVLGQHREVEVQAGEFVNQEQRRLRTAGPHRDHTTRRGIPVAQPRRQQGDAGLLEHIVDGHLQTRLGDLVDQPDRGQGMAAEFEEVVVAPYPLHAQQFGPDHGQQGLGVAFGGLVFAVLQGFGVRQRQGLAVELAVGA
ncbi:hypothetical protein D3C80_769630 [compost metagenome]